MSVESGVISHYSAYDVLAKIKDGLVRMGVDPDHVEPGVLAPVDEFHIGGAEATAALLDRLDVRPGMEVLDIGCGIGGPARAMARRSGAHVTGIDLTPDFVETARELSRISGMGDAVAYEVASATDLPFVDGRFDLATMLHVGMNIPDKDALFSEAARVLRAGGTFAVYDVMRTGSGELTFPVPWAESDAVSALAEPKAYRSAARASGLRLAHEEDRREVALAFFERIQAAASGSAPAPLGLHLLMGPTVRDKTANMMAAIRAGTIAPVQMIFRKNDS